MVKEPSRQGGQEVRGRGVVTESLADVPKAIDITGSEDETAAQLKRVLPQFVLVVAGIASPLSGDCIIAAQQMKQIGGFQFNRVIGLPLLIDQKREGDARLVAELPGIDVASKTDRGEGCAFVAESLIMSAQLRDVLAAKNSSVVA